MWLKNFKSGIYGLCKKSVNKGVVTFLDAYIMLDVLKRDSKASFFFVGAEDEKDQKGMMSRRFRLYRRFVLSTVSEEKFDHYRRNDLSLYILVNKKSVDNTESYAERIADVVQQYL